MPSELKELFDLVHGLKYGSLILYRPIGMMYMKLNIFIYFDGIVIYLISFDSKT